MKSLESAKIQYENLEYIGEGASGTIYRALRRGIKQHCGHVVALKILKSKKAFQELAHEYEALLKIESPYILKIFSLEETQLGPALIMEYSDGVSLYEFWKKGLLCSSGLRKILLQLQEALHDLKCQNIFHGDLNLKNILLAPNGCIKLIDFGNSYEKNQGKKVTTLFAAPECLEGCPNGIFSDLYSLAKIEEFLSKGESRIFSDNLCREASQRKFFQSSEVGSLENLARSISIYIDEKNGASTQQIQKPISTISRPRWKEACLFAIFFILPHPFAIPESVPLQEASRIEIRSKNWMEISVNGKTLGFTPLQIVTREKHLKIQWKNASSDGELEYYPRQKNSILTEQELFHP